MPKLLNLVYVYHSVIKSYDHKNSKKFPIVQGMWALRWGTELDNMLILSFIEQTRVLSVAGEEVNTCAGNF